MAAKACQRTMRDPRQKFWCDLVGFGAICLGKRVRDERQIAMCAKRTEFGADRQGKRGHACDTTLIKIWRNSDGSAPQLPPPRLSKSRSLRSRHLRQNLPELV
jgi:hypothetical protein